MNFEKKIALLQSENEFLQLQLEDLNKTVRQKDEEISLLADDMDSAAALQSLIDNNLAEIAQLKYNNSLTVEKAAGLETLNETLENDLLAEIRSGHKNEKLLQEMDSVKANLEAANEELEQSSVFYQRILKLKAALAEATSNIELLQMEIVSVKEENEELKQLVDVLRHRKVMK